MSQFWQVLGRFCSDEDFRQEVLAESNPATNMMTDLPHLHNVLTGKYSLALTRWEFMEVNRLVGEARAQDFAVIQAAWGGAPRFDCFWSIVGLSCIDPDLRDALHAAQDADEVAQVLSEPPELELPDEGHRFELGRLMRDPAVYAALQAIEQFGWVIPGEPLLPTSSLSCAAGFRFRPYRHLELAPKAA